jgi:hypothetical protein
MRRLCDSPLFLHRLYSRMVRRYKIRLPLALHPSEERYIDAASYRQEVGAGSRQFARCPFCRREMMAVVDDGEEGLQFFHRQHLSSSPCPLTTNALQPDGLSVECPRDFEVERRNRGLFLAEWQSHLAVMAQQVPSISIERFVRLVSYADVLNLWSYEALEQRDIPFILLVLAEVIADVSAGHGKMWVRFVFEGRIKRLSDLWAQPELNTRLFRIRYKRLNGERMPTARDIVACEEVERPRIDERDYIAALTPC